jgi:hypothetical protein
MKPAMVAWGLASLVAGAAFGQTDSVRGFADFHIAPPHNEIDTGLCSLATNNPFPNTTCSAYARYAGTGYLEVQPLKRRLWRRAFAFWEPKIFAGDNIPRLRYTASASPVLWESGIGAGFELPKRFELRYEYHKAYLLGRYSGASAAGTVNPDGPYGRNTTIGVRWKFGGGSQPSAAGTRGFARGYVDFDVAPPHDEVDLGLCSPLAGTGCAAYGRYVLGGYLELQPARSGRLSRGFLFFEPKIYGGNNVPQVRYTADASPILWEFNVGVAVELPGRFELRFTHHGVDPLGRYAGAGSAATLRSDGPYGNNSTIGVRWNFGRERSDTPAARTK